MKRLLFLFLSFASVQFVIGSDYSLRGNVTVSQVSGQAEYKSFKLFSVAVGECRWSIETVEPGTNIATATRYFIGCTNDTEVFQFAVFKKDKRTVGSLDPVPYPLKSADGVGHYLWSALASQCAVTSSQVRLPPIYDPVAAANFDASLTTKVLAERSESVPYCATRLIYLSDGKVRSWLREEKKLQEVDYPYPFDQGFTNAEMRVLRLTNVSGLTLPQEFEFVYYKPHFEAGNPVLRKALVVHGVVTNTSTKLRDVDFQPAISSFVSFQDRRFRSSEDSNRFMTYSLPKGSIPAPERAVQLEKEKIATRGSPDRGGRLGKFSIVGLFVLLMMAVGPLVFLLAKRKQ